MDKDYYYIWNVKIPVSYVKKVGCSISLRGPEVILKNL